MRDYVTQLLTKYRNSGILLDANILILYFVGSLDRNLIPKFGPTKIFTKEDYNILFNILRQLRIEKFVTTPNVLTEVNNLANKLPENYRLAFLQKFAREIPNFEEHYLPSSEVSQTPVFKKLGLTDAGIVGLVKDKHLVVTMDFPLSNYLQYLGIDDINFNHIRAQNWKLG